MGEKQPIRRPCKWCRTVFTPNRVDKKFCKPGCRKAAGRYRQRHALGDGRAVLEPQLSSETVREELQEHCEITGRPMPAEDPYLTAYARYKEAEEQVRRWSHALELRRVQLQKLPRPAMAARLVQLSAEASIDFPRADERFMGLSCSGPLLAFLVFGRKREPAEE